MLRRTSFAIVLLILAATAAVADGASCGPGSEFAAARVRWAAPTYGKVYVNRNQLLTSYSGADGIKTGWTTLANHCLVASAHRHGVRLIAVVLRSRDPYRDAARLLNFGFELEG